MTSVVTASEECVGVPADLTFVDCDAHWTEPADLWTARVPEKWHDRVPQLQRVNGRDCWVLNNEVWATTGANVLMTNREKMRGGHLVDDFSTLDPSAWSVKERLELMDDIGAQAAVIYPNGVGFASNHMFAIDEESQRQLVFQTYNDFFAELQADSGSRLLPQAMLPIWDMDLTVREITRMLDVGIRGFTLSDKPEMIGLPELWEPYFAPMWDLLNDSRSVANFHIASGRTKAQFEAGRKMAPKSAAELGSTPTPPQDSGAGHEAVDPAWNGFGKQRRLAVKATQMYMSNVRIVVNMCMSNLFDRYPNLKVVSAESGIGWVPFILEALEYQFDEMVADPEEIRHAAKRPREYFQDHINVMFWFERSAPEKLIADIGAGNILVESDVPHSTCLYPSPRSHFEDVLGNVPTTDVRKILYENAATLYKITP